MTIVILGCDGYTGYPLYDHLRRNNHDVIGVDNLNARIYRGQSVLPIEPPSDRYNDDEFTPIDITDYNGLTKILRKHDPDTVVNLAQIPAAPYSMRSINLAWHTQENNIRGALNLYWAIHELGLDTHVVQLATMGEYGCYDDAPIPEGFLEDGRPAPKDPGSFYHASKVAATVNTYFAAKTWGIPTTEIYQGIVYGVPEHADTRFDVDGVWGTVLNRFTAQAAVGEPLTVYGRGGQKRAMLSLTDCIQCLTLAINNPPTPEGVGRYPYRAINQFDGAYRVRELAELVSDKTGAEITHVENPRVEDDSEHYYWPEREVLDRLGYEPTRSIGEEFDRAYSAVTRHAGRVEFGESPQWV